MDIGGYMIAVEYKSGIYLNFHLKKKSSDFVCVLARTQKRGFVPNPQANK
jgi:hypothetical protein